MQARPPQAQAVGDAKQSAMDGALYHVAVTCQELVADPVEGTAGVGAGIDIGEYRRTLSHQA